MDLEVARNFLIALLLGALVGVERERKKAAEPARSFGGIRTHILLALAGAASARLSALLSMPWLFAATLLVVGAPRCSRATCTSTATTTTRTG